MEGKKYRRCFSVLITLLCILFISFRYSDLKYIIFYQYSFADNLLNHPETGFYSYCLQQWELFGYETGACQAFWGMPMYVILGIWGIPVYIASKVTSLSIYQLLEHLSIVVYGKMILLIFLIGTMFFLLKIMKYGLDLRPENEDAVVLKHENILIFLSSYFVVAPVFIQGQSDIIEIFFMVLGTYFLIVCKDKRRFIMAFMVSVSLKQVSVLYFIPLLLLTEKRISRILVNLGAMMSLTVFCRVVFGGPSDVSVNMGCIESLLGNRLPLLGGDIPLFLLLYMGICAVSFFYKWANQAYNDYCVICMLGLVIYGGMNIFSNQIYRCIYVAPFIIMGLSLVQVNRKKVLFLETMLEACYAFYQICKFDWCFEITNCSYMIPEVIFGKLPENGGLLQVSDITASFSSRYFDVIVGSGVILLVVVIWAALSRRYSSRITIPVIEELSIRHIMIFRIVMLGCITLMPVLIYSINIIRI